MEEGGAASPLATEEKVEKEEEDDLGYRLFPERNKNPQSFLVRSLFTYHNKCQVMLRMTLETSRCFPAPWRERDWRWHSGERLGGTWGLRVCRRYGQLRLAVVTLGPQGLRVGAATLPPLLTPGAAGQRPYGWRDGAAAL